MMVAMGRWNLVAAAVLLLVAVASGEPPVVGQPLVLNDDGAWCWFQDERAILDGDWLLVQSVTADGATRVTGFNLATGERDTVALNDDRFSPNDHNVGALLVRSDGRYLALYAGHNAESFARYRISVEPGDFRNWGEEGRAQARGDVTYSNVYRLGDTGLTYNFYRDRGAGWEPNYMVSDDDGETWTYGGRLFTFGDSSDRPYVRYTSDDRSRVHFATTENHPRDYPNSVYHGYIEDGRMFRSDGTPVGPLSDEAETEISPADFTRVFAGDADHVAWTTDIELDDEGRPYVAFSVTRDQESPGSGGMDHRYHYARWDGERWQEQEIAYAGTRLYPREDEYTGLISLHPEDPDVVYISANVDPDTGEPLKVNGEQRYEIFRGDRDGGQWQWTAVTEDSPQDNLRPIVVADDNRTVLLWLRGTYNTYTDFDQKVYARIEP